MKLIFKNYLKREMSLKVNMDTNNCCSDLFGATLRNFILIYIKNTSGIPLDYSERFAYYEGESFQL